LTAQVSERLIMGGKEVSMFTNPLGLYLRVNKIHFESPHTANWRGYVGTWEIKEYEGVERLYLVGLHGHKTYEEIVGVCDIFPGFDTVFAHWFSGEVRLPQGAQLKYRHMGYGSIYEYDFMMQFKYGVLVNKYARHNEAPEENPVDQSKLAAFLRRSS
jgi:hypothetical protein